MKMLAVMLGVGLWLSLSVGPAAAKGGPNAVTYSVEFVVPEGSDFADPTLVTHTPAVVTSLSFAFGDYIEPIQPTGSDTPLTDGGITVREQGGAIVAVEVFLNGGPGTTKYRTDRLAVDPPVAASPDGFVLALRLDSGEVYEEAKRGHRVVLGEISIGDIVYTPSQ